MSAPRQAVFLDRDGVLNEAVVRDGMPYPPASVEEVVIPPDARAALEALRARGFRLIVVTNQPDVRRGKTLRETIDAINRRIADALPIDAIEMCLHDDADGCDCRKPKPGMLLRAAAREDIELPRSFMVGDRWRDVEAGQRAGCRTILIGDGYSEGLRSKPDISVKTLGEAARWILETASRGE